MKPTPRAEDIIGNLQCDGQWKPKAFADLIRLCISQRRTMSEAALADWCAELCRSVYPDAEAPSALVSAVIEALVQAGDIGRGRSFSELVLLAVPPTVLELSDCGQMLLGDWPETGEQRAIDGCLFRFAASTGPSAQVDPLSISQYFGRPEKETRDALQSGTWIEGAPHGRQLVRLAAVFGQIDSTGARAASNRKFSSLLLNWAGIGVDTGTMNPKEDGPTGAQRKIVQANPAARLLVEAGPGSGKTYVACSRVAHLLQHEQIEPERILVLSFTRVAVAEIRKRIANALPTPGMAQRLNIATFDSFAARLLRIGGLQSPQTGYDAAIRRATGLLTTNDELQGLVEDLDHIIIDEAQDILGVRRSFCQTILDGLYEQCGVTILGDAAQSIFDYDKEDLGKSLFEKLKKASEFEVFELLDDQRTRSSVLKDLFQDARSLLKSPDVANIWSKVKFRIEDAAMEVDIPDIVQRPDLADNVVLVRTRAEVHQIASRFRNAGRPCRVRLSGRPDRTDPWIAAAIGDLDASLRLGRDDILVNLRQIVEDTPDDILDQTWSRLQHLAGGKENRVRVGDVADELDAGVPLEFLRSHEGATGPLIATVHAWKGREAGKVVLCIPNRLGDHSDPLEEARVLFVGATRAMEELRTAKAFHTNRFHTLSSGRRWLATSTYREVEIGLDGDVMLPEPVSGQANDRLRSSALWTAATRDTALVAVGEQGNWKIHVDTGDGHEKGPSLGNLSPTFAQELLELPEISTHQDLPKKLTGFRLAGATTSVTRRAADGQFQIGLQPMLGGLARLYRE